MRRLVVALSCALVLAGCGGDPKADPSPAPSSPTTSAAPTPTPPAMPEAAKANTKAGAVAFVKYYIELINHAQATGDVAKLETAEASSCDSCRSVSKSIATIYQAGGSISGGTWHPHLNSALHNADGSWLVNGYVEIEPSKIRRSDDGPTESEDGGSAGTHVTAKFSSGHWKVTKWSRDS